MFILTVGLIHNFCLSVETEEESSLLSDLTNILGRILQKVEKSGIRHKDGLSWYFIKGAGFRRIFTSTPVLTRASTTPCK